MKDWRWTHFRGSQACLKWAQRDLQSLQRAIDYCTMRRACVQAGGNLGVFPKYLAQFFEMVYTFEPDPALFEMMAHNAPEPNIFKIQAAVGADNNPVRLECKRRDTSGRPVHEGLTHVAGAGKIPCLRIDDLNLKVCDLLYLDVEGWEYFGLLGAVKTLKQCRPVVGVEINRNIGFAGCSAAELRKLLLSFGYRHRVTMHSDEIYTPT